MRSILTQLIFFFITASYFAIDVPFKPVDNVPLFFSNAEKLNEFTTRIPFKTVDRLLVIEGMINDKKGNFIIDTGSEALILNKVHFNTFLYNNQKEGVTSGVISTLDNPLEKTIRKLSLENLNLKNKNSDVINLSHIEKSKKIKLLGIIGYSILKDYEIFIDLYLNQITLTKIDKEGNKKGNSVYLEEIVDSVKFDLKKHTIVLEAFVNKEKINLGLDTGAEFNQINNRINKQVLKSFYPKKRIQLTGASSKKIEVLYGNLHRVQLNDKNYFGPMKTILTNLNNMNKAFGTNLDGILGYDFFAQKRVIINYKKEILYFVKHPLIR